MFTTRAADKDEDLALLGRVEDQFCDFKSKRIAPAKLQRHVVALANSDGGDLFVGVEDHSTRGERIQGFHQPEDANDIVNSILSQLSPPVEGMDLEFIDFGSRGLVLHAVIPKSDKVHHTSDGLCYIRQNASSPKISGEQVIKLGYAKGTSSFERQPVADASADWIARSGYLFSYLRRVDSALDGLDFLRRQRLLQEVRGTERPAVAGVLLFDDEPQATLNTRCAIKIYRLYTSDSEFTREQMAADAKTIEGPLELQINSVLEWVKVLLRDARVVVGGDVVPVTYPTETLKEILVNAVLHRDYSLNDDIHVRIFNNRVEIQSPGRLPGYITTKNILQERYSRNPTIVRLLHKLPDPPNKDIGEGLNTAFTKMREAGLVPPQIDERENCVLVTIKHQPLASLEELILEFLDRNEWVRNQDVRKLSGEGSENRVKKALQRLRESGKIVPEDPNASPFNFRYRKATAQDATLFER